MEYFEGLKKLKEIEHHYNVMSIKINGTPIWPFLRIYLFQLLAKTNHVNAHNISAYNVKIVLKSLFKYNPLRLFRKYDYWLFNAKERRKEIRGVDVHRVSGFVSHLNINFLDIEKPSISQSNKNCKIEEQYIVSESWWLLFSHIFERILRLKKLKIQNENILDEINTTTGLNFNYKYYVRFLLAQKHVTNFFLSLSGKPRTALFECPYNIMGYIWSLKCHNIKVIELQHGVINDSHYAYVFPHSSIFSPDELWVYGDREYDFLTNINTGYSPKIRKTGLYILERANKAFSDDIFAQVRRKYRSIVVFAGQSAVVKPVHSFLRQVSLLNDDILFIYIPRNSTEVFEHEIPNILVKKDVNIYQYLKWCDIHATVSSTTCLEAAYFKKPTIFFDYEKMATAYYGNYLKENNGVRYTHNAEDFKQAHDELINDNNIIYKNTFSPFNIPSLI